MVGQWVAPLLHVLSLSLYIENGWWQCCHSYCVTIVTYPLIVCINEEMSVHFCDSTICLRYHGHLRERDGGKGI